MLDDVHSEDFLLRMRAILHTKAERKHHPLAE